MKEEIWKRGWKVVYVSRGGEETSMSGDLFPRTITYKPLAITIPKSGFGPLTVFKTRKAARYMQKNMRRPYLGIRKCFYVPSRCCIVWEKGTGWFNGPFKTIKQLELINPEVLLPGQTVLADKVITLPDTSHHKGK